MKYAILLLILFTGSTTTAFFPQKDIERNSKSVHIDIQGHQAHIEILEKVYNPSLEETKTVQFFDPIPSSARNIEFFVDAEKKVSELFEGKPMLEKLFEKATLYQDHRFFSLGKYENTKLFASHPLEIPPSKEILKKLTFDFEIETLEDFAHINIWPKDDIPTKKAEIALSLNTNTPIQHFFTTAEENGLVLKENNQLAYLLEKENFNPTEDIELFWSLKPSTELKFLLQDETYIAHFLPPAPQKNISHITFLIDQSGSLLGAPWERVQEYMHFWLEQLPEETHVKVIFFHEALYPYQEEFEANSNQFRKQFINYIDGKIPQGKTDLVNILSLLPENIDNDLNNQVIVLLTDASPELNLPLINNFPIPIITLDLSPEGSIFLKLLASKSEGFYQKLFRTPWKLVEAEELWNQWTTWTTPLPFPEKEKTVNEREIFPPIAPPITKPSSPTFIGRVHTPSLLIDNSNTSFLPKTWAARRIGDLLETYNLENTETLDALLAIGRTFGIKTRFFEDTTTREELKNTFKELKNNNQIITAVETTVLKLKNPNQFTWPSNAQVIQGIPFYYDQNENTWRHFNFADNVSPSTHLAIAPFSEAQKALFVEFPEMVAESFGIGNQVQFCTIFRCISVKEGSRENYLPSDRAFFRDFNPNHWALPYLIKLIDEGTLEPEINGKLHPDRAIDRGTFVKMLVEHLWGEEIPASVGAGLQPALLPDIQDTEFETAVKFLVHKGVIKGYPDGTFRPYQSLTRGEAAKIMLASVGYIPDQPISEEPLFPDATGWEKSWVNETFRRGLAKGYPDGNFRPGQELTRAEASKLIVEVRKYKK